MPLDFAAPSNTVLDALQNGLAQLSGDAPVVNENFNLIAVEESGAPPEKSWLQSSLAHPVYSIGVRQLADGQGLQAAKPVSWAFFINPVPSSAVTAEVNSGATSRFAGSVQGPVTEGTLDAIQQASRNPIVVNGSYELRLLRITSLSFAAVWLADKSGTDDIFIPLKGVSRNMDPSQTYTKEQLMAELTSYARKEITSTNQNQGTNTGGRPA